MDNPEIGDWYEVKKTLFFTDGSNTFDISGTYNTVAKRGDVIQYDGGSYNGDTYWIVHDKRVRFECNGWCPMLVKSLKKIME